MAIALIMVLATSSRAFARSPNVVVLLADDAGWGDFGFNGNTNVSTPNIDRLARDGAVFDYFYVSSVCVPTRAEFLTGRYYLRTGVLGLNSGQERIDLDERTIADAFKAAGYATGAFGKWHNGTQGPYHPNARGFDEFYGFTSGHSAHYFDAPMDRNGRMVRGRGYIADDITDHALAFITQNRERPFFCYVPFNTPHSPFCVPDEHWNRQKENPCALRGPDGDRENLTTTRAALAMCENLDWNVGRILDRLAALDLASDTIVAFFSDNGPATLRWNVGLKGKKGTNDEGGVRAPCAIRWPGKIAAGTRVRDIAGAIDLVPTLTGLADIPRAGAKPFDGCDLSPLLRGHATHWPERLLFSHTIWNGRVSVRSSRFRLDPSGALFDIASDPRQQHDVAARFPETVAQLAKAVAAWRIDVSDGATGDGDRSRARPAARIVDPRPLPVGFAKQRVTALPAGDAIPRGGVRRSAAAPSSSYLTHWSSTTDAIVWNIEVLRPGSYDIVVYYTCPESDVGSVLEMSFGDARVSAPVMSAWDPPLVTHEDRAPRETESYMKEFRPLRLGSMRMPAGRGELVLRATRIPGRHAAEINLVTLAFTAP